MNVCTCTQSCLDVLYMYNFVYNDVHVHVCMEIHVHSTLA